MNMKFGSCSSLCPTCNPKPNGGREVTNKVECPACGKKITLRKNGRFWQHNNGKPQYPGSIWMENCEMSGRIDTRNRD